MPSNAGTLPRSRAARSSQKIVSGIADEAPTPAPNADEAAPLTAEPAHAAAEGERDVLSADSPAVAPVAGATPAEPAVDAAPGGAQATTASTETPASFPKKAGRKAAAGTEAAGPKSGLAGWVRVDTDGVLRGWATDRSDRSARLPVRIFIDDQAMATVVASRLDPKLIELGEDDGRYAFAYAIPEPFRDGAQHTFRAEVDDGKFRLKSKLEQFTIEAGVNAPDIFVSHVDLSTVRGWLYGGQYSKSTFLEFWDGGELIEEPAPTIWRGGDSTAIEFEVQVTPDIRDRLLARDLVLAAPGMVEAGLNTGVAYRFTIDVSASLDAEGHLLLTFADPAQVASGGDFEIVIAEENTGAELLRAPLSVLGDAAELMLPPEIASEALKVGVALKGGAPITHASLSRIHAHAVTNASFSDWSSDGPTHWQAPGPAEVHRGFYAFPKGLQQARNLTGDFARFVLPESEEERTLVRQPLGVTVAAHDEAPMSIMVRSSAATVVDVRVVGAGGVIAAQIRADLRRPWTWTFASEVAEFAQGVKQAVLEVTAPAGPAIEVDIAGLAWGGHGFPEAKVQEPVARTESTNLVVNADLLDWPAGVAIEQLVGRGELARGWYGFNRRSTSPMRARAIFGDEHSDQVSLAFGADRVPEYCRLEVQVDPALGELPEALLSFEVGMPAAARRLFRSSDVALPEFLIIDRVMVLRRSMKPTANGQALVDETVATPGRKLLVRRSFQTYELPFQLAKPTVDTDFDWDIGEPAGVNEEYFLVFEFKQPFAIGLRGLSVTRRPETTSAEAPYLMLEDRSIAAQASHVVGLARWVAPELVNAADEQHEPTGGDLRWRWSMAEQGSVEVVICVYNAVEETLACLASLNGATEVPHTVRIIDDGSEPTNLRRLQDFVSDKPWMTLSPNGRNRGYTYSADRGIRESEADWVVLLNSDTIVTNGWLEGLLEAAASDPKVGFVGPVSNAATFQSVPDLYDSRSQWKTNDLPQGWTPNDMAALVQSCSERAFPRAPLLNGFCTLMKRSVFLEVGGLNATAFPMGYGEENDLCLRVSKAGYSLIIADQVYVYHSKSASFGSARRTELAKAGGKMFRDLHPDADLPALTTAFRDTPALVSLRSAVRRAYDQHL